MFKKTLLFMLLTALLVPWAAMAQETVTIGDGTSNNYITPIGTYYNYSITEQLYTADEIGMAGTISSISFNYAGTAAKDLTITVYMKNVEAADLSTGISLADAEIVFDGTLSVTGAGWATITLDDAFAYDGASNLLIGLKKDAPNWYSGGKWYYTEAANMARYSQQDGSTPYTTSTVPGNATNQRPNIQIAITPSSSDCDMPTAIAVSDITNDGATVTWEGEGNTWNLRYKASTDDDYTLVEGLTSKTYTFEGTLANNTTYNVGVQTVCTESTSLFKSTSFKTEDGCAAPTNLQITGITAESATLSWTAGYQEREWTVKYKKSSESTWTEETVSDDPTIDLRGLASLTTYNVQVYNCENYVSGNFTTATSIPLNEPFNASSIPTGWAMYTGLLSNVMSGTALSSSTYGWSFGSGNGVFDSHVRVNIYGNSCNRWLVLPTLVMEDNVQLTFDMALTKYSGDLQPIDNTLGQDDRFIVLITTDGGTTWEILREWNNTGSEYVYNDIVCSATGQAVAIDLSSYAGQSIALAFYGESTVSETGSDNYLHIDNVSIDYIPDCAKPTGVAASDVTAHEATVTWTSDATAWQVQLNDEDPIDVREATYTFERLDPETTYTVKVRSNCDGVYSEWTTAVSFTTTIACPAPTALAVTPDALTATFTWESNADAWEVAYATTATAEPAENIVGTVNTATYTVNDLDLGDYYFWVRANCGDLDGNSTWAGPASVHIGYCVPNPTSHDGSGITGVSFGMGDYVVENGGEGSSIPATSPFYGDYTDMIGAVQAGVESTISITTATGNYPYTFVIWVDFDNSMSFEDSEIVYIGKASSGAGTLEAKITVPADQALGDYRMRIYGADSYFSSFYNNGNTNWDANHDPCSSGSFRHANDYTLRVLEAPACLTPTNLAVTTDGQTAIATWEGTADSYNIDINGEVTERVTSPYEFRVELSTTYDVKVQADCGNNETSDWTNAVSFTTPACIGGHTIEYNLVDSYSDGWNGASITVIEGCDNVVETLTVTGSSNTGTLTLCGDYIKFVWNSGNYDSECSFTFTENGTTLFTKPSSVSDGMVLYTIGTQSCAVPTGLTAGTPANTSVELSWTSDADARAWQLCVNGDEDRLIEVETNPYTLGNLTPDTQYTVKIRTNCGDEQSCWSDEITFTTAEACAKPTGLAEADITINSATLSWTGTADSYVLQYRPWYQVGEDQVATAVLTTYTYDLSEYSGTGSIAIRHYDVSDMFQLNVDDIVVTNAAGTTVYTQSFESGSIPSEISNMDLDGDGYIWGIRQNGSDSQGNAYCNGSYCASSASWDNGALFPDNWMIISGIELGGQISFVARGQDPEWAQENFAVYVSAEADAVETNVRGTSYAASDLTPNTPYAWQVKADCGDYESNWVSSFFKTKDDALVFATAGNWNVVTNWKDADGNTATALPTVDNNVRIDADAEIPSGVVAQANKITIGQGSITIKDGGQLKQNSATVKVTVEKEITGYGETEGNYYFIACPFSGRTLFDETTDWNHVENLLSTGDYDLYAFDASAEDDLEWINYKSSATHSAFQSDNGNAGLMGGEGYLYGNKAGTTLEFVGSTGKSNNYSETKEYSFVSGYGFSGWALVGNFFACNAYINYIDAEGNVLDADFYTLNNDNTYSLMSSNQPLPPCTGALINYSATGKVQYATEAPTGSKSGMLNMTVTQGRGNVDQARVRFGQGYNLGKMNFRNSSSLYIPQDNNDYAVVYAENVGEMPVNFKAENSGTYTISFSNQDVEFSYLHLIDNLTGNDVDLLANPSYSFDARTTDYASRFRLVFATGNASDDNFAFFYNGNLVISNEGNATMNVYDVTGRLVNTQTINGSCEVGFNAPAGVYMIQLVNGNNTKTQKIVVK